MQGRHPAGQERTDERRDLACRGIGRATATVAQPDPHDPVQRRTLPGAGSGDGTIDRLERSGRPAPGFLGGAHGGAPKIGQHGIGLWIGYSHPEHQGVRGFVSHHGSCRCTWRGLPADRRLRGSLHAHPGAGQGRPDERRTNHPQHPGDRIFREQGTCHGSPDRKGEHRL